MRVLWWEAEDLWWQGLICEEAKDLWRRESGIRVRVVIVL